MKKYGVRSAEYGGEASRRLAGARGGRRAPLATPYSLLRTARAFTLVELLIVLAIIGLVVALGVPLFGVLTGSKSQEAGQNVVAAAIGQARTIALNEGKYAGLLFYVDPATERTAMSLVIVQDPASGLEDADPYDKYKAFVGNQVYRAPFVSTNGTSVVGDRVISLTSDASAMFRSDNTTTPSNDVYLTTAPVYSRLSLYFGNFRPTVRAFRARMDPSNTTTGAFAAVPDSSAGALRRPPQNGPYRTGTGSQYVRIPGVSSGAGRTAESVEGPFENTSWGPNDFKSITPYSSAGERQLLPLGVGVQLLIQSTLRADDPAAAQGERYVRTGLIMFDPQGRLTLDTRSLGRAGTLGSALGLVTDIDEIPAAVGVVFYDRNAFRTDPTRSEADWLQQNVAGAGQTRINSTLASFNDLTSRANEMTEEGWLDTNATPLLINRFSGALSEAQ